MKKTYLIDDIGLLDRQIVMVAGEGQEQFLKLILIELGEKFEDVTPMLVIDLEDSLGDIENYPHLVAPVLRNKNLAERAINFLLGTPLKARCHRLIILIVDPKGELCSKFMTNLQRQSRVTFITTSEIEIPMGISSSKITLHEDLKLEIRQSGGTHRMSYPVFDPSYLRIICDERGYDQLYSKYLIRALLKSEVQR